MRDGGGYVLPERSHVEALLAFDRDAKAGDRLVVLCPAGISCSTASFVALLAQRWPAAAGAFAELRAIRPCSWTNCRFVAFADDILGTRGTLMAALCDYLRPMREAYPDLLMQAKRVGADAPLRGDAEIPTQR